MKKHCMYGSVLAVVFALLAGGGCESRQTVEFR